MPFILPFVPLILGGLAAAGTGVGLYETISNEPGTPKVSTTPSPLTTTQNAAQTAAVSQQLPNLQSLTGGSLSPEYASQFGALQSGVGNDPRSTGDIQSAINQYFGLTAPGQTGLTPSGSTTTGGPGITSLPSPSSAPSLTGGGGGGIMDLLRGGGGSPNLQGWIQQALQNNDFKGLAA